jgi:hypothetical protein
MSSVRPRCDGAGFRGSTELEPWVSLTVAPAVRRLNVNGQTTAYGTRARPGELGKPISYPDQLSTTNVNRRPYRFDIGGPVLVRAVAASMASGEVTRPVAASRPAMQGPSQDHRALVVGRARGAISLVLHHRQPPAQRAARSRRWSTTSPRPVGRPCDIGNQLIQPDTEHGTHSTHLCCSEYVNNAPSLNPLESCRAIPLGIRLPPAAIHRKPFSNSFQFQVPVPRITGCRTIAAGEARAAAPADQPPLR